MSDQKLPNTESLSVMQAAIAWEIVRNTTALESHDTQEEARIKLTNRYIEVYEALRQNEPIKQGK